MADTTAPPSTSEWPGAGVVLSHRYELRRCLAVGSSGAVWVATDRRLRREVAIKLLLPHQAVNEEAVERFHQEALAAVRASHLNAVRVYDAGHDGDLHFMVMELVGGGRLDQFAGQVLDPRQVAAIGVQVARALGAAHETGLIHRDVRPANILIAEDGWVKILDFGIVRKLDAGSTATMPNRPADAIRYIAPEQITGGRIGPWTDVYSLGLVLWECATGQKVFDRETVNASALARLHEDVPPTSAEVPGIDPSLDAIIARATRRDVAERQPDGRTLAEQLTEVSGPRPHDRTRRLWA